MNRSEEVKLEFISIQVQIWSDKHQGRKNILSHELHQVSHSKQTTKAVKNFKPWVTPSFTLKTNNQLSQLVGRPQTCNYWYFLKEKS